MWYVIQVKAGAEKELQKKCRRALPMSVCSGVFVPKFRKMMKFKGVWKEEERILFPGYLFIEVAEQEGDLYGLEQAELLEEYLQPLSAIARPVCIGGGFYPIRKEEEAFLRSMMDESYVLGTSIGYVVDESLIVTEGPLIQYADCVKWFDRHKRIGELELALWGEKRKVTVGLEVVARVTGAEFEEIQRAG